MYLDPFGFCAEYVEIARRVFVFYIFFMQTSAFYVQPMENCFGGLLL